MGIHQYMLSLLFFSIKNKSWRHRDNEEELAQEDFVDEGVLVGGRGGGRTHALEIGDSERDEVAVQA